MYTVKGDDCIKKLVKNTKQKLAFSPDADFIAYRKQLKEKLRELLGMDKLEQEDCRRNIIISEDEKLDGYRRIRFIFNSEHATEIPCYLLIPDTGERSYPLAITLQGHKLGGMYNSLGITRNEDDEAYQPRGAFALQAVENGFAALCVELRGMGERIYNDQYRGHCDFNASVSLMMGRTILGERVWDVMRAIDMCATFPQVDTSRIVITGNSGGGTLSFYTACLDDRIKLCAPSCAFCTYKKSILAMPHCICNYIPHAYEWFEMSDLTALIAPKRLLIISGIEDKIFPIDGVKEGFETVKQIYDTAGYPDNCRLLVTPKGHWWCHDLIWPAIMEEFEKIW